MPPTKKPAQKQHTRLLFLVGRPNSGKTTQAALFASAGATVLSPGSWLRSLSEKHTTSDLGAFVFHNWNHDALTPLVTEYLDGAVGPLLETTPSIGTIVVDGFPRNASEAWAIPRICRGHECLIVELGSDEKETRERAQRRMRGSDDVGVGLDIRLESYDANITDVKRILEKAGIEVLRINNHEDKNTPEDIFYILTVLMRSDAPTRAVIPAHTPRKTLARRLLVEAKPIQSAIVIQRALRLARSTLLRKMFWGTHPISLTRDQLCRIRRYPYLVSLKVTGVRYMCLVHDERLWFISRTLEVYVSHHFPGLGAFHDTLVDGELIGGEDAAHFIVLDCLAANGENCMRYHIMDRLRKSVHLGKFLFNGPLFFRPQEYVDRSQLSMLLQRSSALPWHVDGVILQPARLPYRLGTDFNMFKWKPIGENSVDFYFSAANRGLYCRLTTRDETKPSTAPLDLSHAPRLTIKKIELVKFGRLLPRLCPPWLQDGMIIECVALPEPGVQDLLPDIRSENGWGDNELVWVPQQHRGDKLSPNADWAAQSVIQSIVDDITQDELEEQCTGPNLRENDLPPATVAGVRHRRK